MSYLRLRMVGDSWPQDEVFLCGICHERITDVTRLDVTEPAANESLGPAVLVRTKLPRLTANPCGHEQELGAPKDAPLGRDVVLRIRNLIFWP